MDQNVDLKYIVDKLIESGERNLDLQSSTLRALHELKTILDDKSRDHDLMREKLDDVIKVTDQALEKITVIEHKGTLGSVDSIKTGQVQCQNTLKSIDEKVTSIKGLYGQVKNLMIALTAIMSVITIAFGLIKLLQK